MRHLLLPTLFLGLLLGAFALTDWMTGLSLSWPWTLGVLGVGLGLGYGGSRGAARVPRAVILGAFALAVVSLPWVEWDSRKPFLRDLYSIEPGMDRPQVESLMGKYLRGTGFPAHPLGFGGSLQDVGSGRTYSTATGANGQLELVDSVVYRHTHEGWGNADWGIVRFQQGRVVEVSFSPD
jgi:hypothetical protein